MNCSKTAPVKTFAHGQSSTMYRSAKESYILRYNRTSGPVTAFLLRRALLLASCLALTQASFSESTVCNKRGKDSDGHAIRVGGQVIVRDLKQFNKDPVNKRIWDHTGFKWKSIGKGKRVAWVTIKVNKQFQRARSRLIKQLKLQFEASNKEMKGLKEFTEAELIDQFDPDEYTKLAKEQNERGQGWTTVTNLTSRIKQELKALKTYATKKLKQTPPSTPDEPEEKADETPKPVAPPSPRPKPVAPPSPRPKPVAPPSPRIAFKFFYDFLYEYSTRQSRGHHTDESNNLARFKDLILNKTRCGIENKAIAVTLRLIKEFGIPEDYVELHSSEYCSACNKIRKKKCKKCRTKLRGLLDEVTAYSNSAATQTNKNINTFMSFLTEWYGRLIKKKLLVRGKGIDNSTWNTIQKELGSFRSFKGMEKAVFIFLIKFGSPVIKEKRRGGSSKLTKEKLEQREAQLEALINVIPSVRSILRKFDIPQSRQLSKLKEIVDAWKEEDNKLTVTGLGSLTDA